jgi:MFS transporter, Spinster family, sphingosine-1-phosphate transporter
MWQRDRSGVYVSSHSIDKAYLLIILMIILTFNFMDRSALGLVLDNIKVDLRVSDSQLGFLSGIAFALFYSVMGIPIARWADRGNRVMIVSVTTALWSVMVALCGVAASFTQLMLIRIGVGVGEAGCIPPAHSLIADYFTRAERPRAVAIYMLGMGLSMLVGYFAAGWLSELYGWRKMFILMGLPGVGLAALAWLTLKEPSRVNGAASGAGCISGTLPSSSETTVLSPAEPSMKEVFVTLWANTTFRHLLYFWSLLYFFSYGVLNWQPAFFVRSFGTTTGELGTWFALIYGVPGTLGMYWGGEWASRCAANDEARQLKIMAVTNAGFNGVTWSLIYLSHNEYLAYALMALSNLGGATLTGPVLATIQTLVPSRMRAMSIAIIYLFANLIGLGLGPLAVGVVSDALQPAFGQESLRYALLSMCPGFLWASWHLWRASKTVTHDLTSISVDQESIAFNEKKLPVSAGQ